ncbi:MAG: RDD family protein [Spirochaetaceae bacterium]|nr:RDD family protein [Spirochaetaceae bacterium]
MGLPKERDTSLSVQTPEGIEFILYPAGFLIRACSYSIDFAIQLIFIITAALTINSLIAIVGTWLWMLILFGVSWFYHVICEIFFKGQSLGKKILGLRVVRSDGSPINPGASFLRNLLRFADTFLFLYIIALICMSASNGFRRLGDWAADTLVIYTTNSLSNSRRFDMSWLSRYETVTPSKGLSYEEKQTILMFARRYPLMSKARADEIAGSYAHIFQNREQIAANCSDSEYLLGIAKKLSGECS